MGCRSGNRMHQIKQKIGLISNQAGATAFGIFAVLFMVLGLAGVFEPVESFPQIMRDRIRSVDASGDVVLIAVDNRSLSLGDPYPWPRSNFATIIASLDAAGANVVAIELDLSGATSALEDDSLAIAIEKTKAKVFLEHRFSLDVSDRVDNFFPLPKFTKNAQLVNTNVLRDYDGSVRKAPYGVKAKGKIIPSLASVLSGNYRLEESFFPIDYGINMSSIPTISAVDVLNDRWSPQSVRGKTVVIAGTASKEFSTHIAPGKSFIPKTMINIAAAETLMRGQPITLGSFPIMLLGIFAGGIHLLAKNRKLALTSVLSFSAIVILAPILMESYNVRVQIIPGAALVLVSFALRWFVAIKNQIFNSSRTDVESGLKNMTAIETTMISGVCGVAAFKCSNIDYVEHYLKDRVGEAYRAFSRAMEFLGAETYHGGHGIVVGVFPNLVNIQLDDTVEGLQKILRTIHVDGNPIDIIGTVGVSDASGLSIKEKARLAIIASGQAAQNGEVYFRFEQSTAEKVDEEVSLSSRMEAAISNRECEMYLQPKFRLSDQSLIGAEALLRWTHPEHGPMDPGQLIIHAEKYGRIWDITKFGFEETAKFISQLDLACSNLVLSVNLSAKLLSRRDLPEMIIEIISQYGIEPQRFMLEVTETAALSNGDMSLQVLKHLKSVGFALSIDDYGTGSATMDYLKKVPATELKIDRSFVSQMENSQSDAAMVRSTIQLAESLNMYVIAEGIEHRSTVDMLHELGCYGGQGYYFSKPMNLSAAAQYIEASYRNRATG